MINLKEFLNSGGSRSNTKSYSIRASADADLGGLTLKEYLKTQVRQEKIKAFVLGSFFVVSVVLSTVVINRLLLNANLKKQPDNTENE